MTMQLCKPHDTSLSRLDAWDLEVLQHQLYSPDFSPCDFFLFLQLKKKLRGVRFDSVEETENEIKRKFDIWSRMELELELKA